jgi:hypothetical protein
MYNLDASSLKVYVEFNLIEARAAAILTPHLVRHAPVVFFEHFPVPSLRPCDPFLNDWAGKNDWVADKLLEDKLLADKLLADKLLGQVSLFFLQSEAVRCGCLGAFEEWECLIDETYSQSRCPRCGNDGRPYRCAFRERGRPQLLV